MEFTFGVLAFNSEEFILQTLESIKYQIDMYGSGVDIDFVLVDDASTDRTWYLIEKWIEHNREYFRSTLLLKNERNRYGKYIYKFKIDFGENKRKNNIKE